MEYTVLIEFNTGYCDQRGSRTIITWMHSITTKEALYCAIDAALGYVGRTAKICPSRVVVLRKHRRG